MSTNPVAVRAVLRDSDGATQDVIHVWCPGCEAAHHVGVGGTEHPGLPNWTWNGDLERPTFEPSILCHHSVHHCEGQDTFEPCTDAHFESCGHAGHQIMDDGSLAVFVAHAQDPPYGPCHSFLRDGAWEFLGDSAHHLAGQRVPMVPLPDWYLDRRDRA